MNAVSLAMTPRDEIERRKEEILEPLNKDQREVVQNYKGFSLVEAAAGSGKTSTMVARTAYMIEDGVPASSILMFTFTKKAANEMKERVRSKIGDKGVGVTISTYHSFCAKQLRKYCQYLDYNDNFTIIDPDDQKKLIGDILKKRDSMSKKEDLIAAISKFKENHCSPREAAKKYDTSQEQIQEAVEVYETYQKRLKNNNVMDFDDLLFNMVELLEKNELIRQRIYSKYQYIIVDESQDSSREDVRFIYLLMNPRTRNMCMVGDVNQAIYSFRGSDVEYFHDMLNKYEHKTFILGRNYRSTQNIVNGAESLIDYNPQLIAKTSYSKNEIGDKIVYISSKSPAHEAEQISQIIQNGVATGEFIYQDVGILFRNSFLSRNIEDAFVKHQIPYVMASGVSFYERKEVKDLISFIEFFVNPENTLSLNRIINIPKSGIGAKSIEKIQTALFEKRKEYAIITLRDILCIFRSIAAGITKKLSNALNAFVDKCDIIAKFMDTDGMNNPKELVERIVTVFDYKNYLLKYDEDTYEERCMNIGEFINLAGTYNNSLEFLETMMSSSEGKDDKDPNPNKVTMMTMHGSKGLEFPIVIIIDANDGICPSWRCSQENNPQKAVQEERRLFYVAMTRAKKNLIIFSTQSMLRRGRLESTAPSPFISQINERYLERA